MHLRPRLVTSVALLALIVAACGTASSSTPPAASGSPAAPAVATTTDATASASPEAPVASPAPSATTAPAATPTPEQQALMARLPTRVQTLDMAPKPADAQALIDSDPKANGGLVDFLTKIGLTPKDLIIVFDVPTAPTQLQYSLAAYRFIGADPAKLKTEFLQANIDSQPGLTVKDETIGGRKVSALLAPAGDTGPPLYLLFEGDTVYVAASSDENFAAALVQALP